MRKLLIGLLALFLFRIDAIAQPAYEFGSPHDTTYDAQHDVFVNTSMQHETWCIYTHDEPLAAGHSCWNPVKIPAKRKFVFSLRTDLFNERFRGTLLTIGAVPPARRRDVFEQIGNTPLVPFAGIVPNDNRIWVKLECQQPFGSHYDRVYLKLFKHFEEQGLLKPGATVLETTSGSAGVSFAGIGTLLGYKCLVMIPDGGEKARVKAIQDVGGEVIFTPADEYVNGFHKAAVRYLARNRDVVFLNHSMGPNGTENRVTTDALSGIGTELQSQLGSVDYFVAAVGNGSSVLGPARVLASKTKIVTFESFQSGVAYELLYPGEYKRTYGIDPGSLSRHNMPGTSYQGIDFPHIRIAFLDEKLVDETIFVSDRATDEEYRHVTGREIPADIPRWDAHELHPYGRTTRAGLSVALKIAERVRDKDIVIIAYDNEDRYDT